MVGGVQKVSEYYRFCPDAPRVLISDAVCLGRRRSNYPYCKGCQFNDDEKNGGQTWMARRREELNERVAMVEKVFKAYDVRGVYPDPLNETVAWRVGHAAASFLRSSLRGLDRADAKASALVVGRDMRKSSPSLSEALIEGIRSTGTSVIDIGMIDTSQIYFAINHFGACGGVQTTASHNPAQYNGFKISGRKGSPVGSDTGLTEIAEIAKNTARHETTKQGDVSHVDLAGEYKAFVRRFLQPIRPLKVVVDGSNGMAGKWVPIIFDDVPKLELTSLNMEHTGEFKHDPNPLVDENLRELREKVKEIGADFGVCFDGDADRCMLVDENARIIRCDMLTALLAKRFLKKSPGSTIVFDLRSSKVVPETVREAGGIPRRERVGHAFMKKALAESHGVFGGELSGHFYFEDNYYCDSGMLAFVHVLNAVTAEDKSLGALIDPLLKYHSSGERNFENEQKDVTIRKLADRYKDARIDYLDGITVQYPSWWFNVRKSNTEPLLRLNLEADSKDLMDEKVAELSSQLGTAVDH